MTTEEKLIALADGLLVYEETLQGGRPDRLAPTPLTTHEKHTHVVAKALKLVLELYSLRRTSDPELEERVLVRQLDALVKDLPSPQGH